MKRSRENILVEERPVLTLLRSWGSRCPVGDALALLLLVGGRHLAVLASALGSHLADWADGEMA